MGSMVGIARHRVKMRTSQIPALKTMLMMMHVITRKEKRLFFPSITM
jgi:hypothetical protein